MVSLRQLRYALAVWHEGSFVRAAERLNISQPAISGQVRQLEEELGFALYRRTGQGIQTTEIGRAFLMQAEQVYFSATRLTETARQLRGGPVGSFSVGISSGITNAIVPKILRAIEHVRPRARLELTTTTTRRINQLLLDERLDLGITVEANPRALPRDLVRESIARDDMVLVVACRHTLARDQRTIELKDLTDEPLIMNELAVGYGEFVLSMFADQGLQPNIVAISDNVETIKAMVRAGAGIAIVPRLSVENETPSGELANRDISPKKIVEITMVRRVQTMSPLVEEHVALVRQGFPSGTDA